MREYAARMIFVYTPTGWVWVPRYLLEEAGMIEPEPEPEQTVYARHEEEE